MPQLRIKAGYPSEELTPMIQHGTGSSHCLYCESESRFNGISLAEAKKKSKLSKKQRAVLLVTNSGPTGRVFMCLKHARMLRDALNGLALEED